MLFQQKEALRNINWIIPLGCPNVCTCFFFTIFEHGISTDTSIGTCLEYLQFINTVFLVQMILDEFIHILFDN